MTAKGSSEWIWKMHLNEAVELVVNLKVCHYITSGKTLKDLETCECKTDLRLRY